MNIYDFLTETQQKELRQATNDNQTNRAMIRTLTDEFAKGNITLKSPPSVAVFKDIIDLLTKNEEKNKEIIEKYFNIMQQFNAIITDIKLDNGDAYAINRDTQEKIKEAGEQFRQEMMAREQSESKKPSHRT